METPAEVTGADIEPEVEAGVEVAGRPVRPRRGRWTAFLTREYSIAEGAVLLMAAFLVSAMLGSLRQVLLSAQFGAGPEASAYYAAFRLPDGLFALIAGGALSGAMIPVLVSTERDEGDAARQRLIDVTLTTLLAAVTLIVCLAELATPAFVTHLLAPGFDQSTSRLTVNLTRLMLLQPVILSVGSVAFAILNSRARFLLPAVSLATHNLALIAGVLATHLFPGLGIYGPTLGVVAGAVLQVLILLPGLRGDRVGFRPRWDPGDARLREVVALMIPNALAVAVEYSGGIADTAFASRAESAALPAIHNAWLLTNLPISLLGVAIAQSTFPRLAAAAAERQWTRLRATLLRSLGVALLLVVPAVLGLIVLGRLLVRLLFEHGLYDAAAGRLTYDVLAIYVLGLPAYVGLEVVTRGLVAMKDTRTPLATNLGRLALRIALLSLLLRPLGAVAIPAAFAVSGAVEILVMSAILLTRLRRRANQNQHQARIIRG